MIDLELAKKPKVEIPESYENTKVYSLDEDVIRKYAELCGKSIENDDEEYVRAGYGMRRNGLFSSFVAGSHFDGDDSLTTITPEQILASWDLKLNEPSVETLQSALDKSQLKVMELTEQLAEMKGVKDDSDSIALLYLMAAALTSMKTPVTFSESHFATPAADLVAEIIKENNLVGSPDFDKFTCPEFEAPIARNASRTKVEYVKCELSTKDVARVMLDGGTFYSEDGNCSYGWADGHFRNQEGSSVSLSRDFYLRTEVEIDILDAVAEWGHKNKIGIFSPQEFKFNHLLETNKSKAIEMCYLVAELTDKPE